jgi:hypothetical protein
MRDGSVKPRGGSAPPGVVTTPGLGSSVSATSGVSVINGPVVSVAARVGASVSVTTGASVVATSVAPVSGSSVAILGVSVKAGAVSCSAPPQAARTNEKITTIPSSMKNFLIFNFLLQPLLFLLLNFPPKVNWPSSNRPVFVYYIFNWYFSQWGEPLNPLRESPNYP